MSSSINTHSYLTNVRKITHIGSVGYQFRDLSCSGTRDKQLIDRNCFKNGQAQDLWNRVKVDLDSHFLMMATSTYTETAIQTYVLTAFSKAPKKMIWPFPRSSG